MAILSVGERKAILQRFTNDLASYTIRDNETGCFGPVVCGVCDAIPDEPNWSSWVGISDFAELCRKCNMDKQRLTSLNVYPEEMVQNYTVNHKQLESFVLSPFTKFNADSNSVLVCNKCKLAMENEILRKVPLKLRRPPKASLANGYLIGEPPEELTTLNDVELALVTRVRTHCKSWVFFGGCHRHIQGWHTFFRNRPSHNVANLEQLQLSGMKGSILVVLCGPFTKTQHAMIMDKVMVKPEKVIAAMKWLKENNFQYKDEIIPEEGDVPLPEIITENV